ncbi:trifunctional transcriptional regulator/proline dehydrogenase/L-glutamate gamma-semialdehyde dehydrogenase [Hansschlegelia plantiphila]|uniref:Bifunctional protein PutA n=1 Tax=Hansschlegelia plantiphila TaxID=374655 RepID=A0A9W6MVE9_9HYPH|nr:bifunctional protein PutA [Hansschlegelia plantiphila]
MTDAMALSDPAEGRPQAAARRSALRGAITAATLRREPDCVPPLIEAARLPPERIASAQGVARKLVEAVRAKGRSDGVEGLVQEYALSSEEGVALMCLAEALLRIPDAATRDSLIRDKIGRGDWRSHLGRSPSLFVNAATWGLVVTGRLTATASETSLSSALVRLVRRGGEPLIRAGVDLAMRMMGEQFVTGRTIEEALSRAKRRERKGFRYSYDMLGEAATTAEDAARYLAVYEHAIRAVGRASGGRGWRDGPGVSVKLSALHPRYSRAKRSRAMTELLPRLIALARLARSLDVGLNIDAEEADRLELSLDLLEALCFDPALESWDGLGFVVQAYGRRASLVIDWLADLARRSKRRLMVRLVKGAYWDSEIKRAQVLGLADFPVFTRKVHTDVSYLACARKMLDARDALYPQFATHNAMTLATIREMAGPDCPREAYEFQCLHGMGEPLYDEVVGPAKLDRPCRVYAPVGSHETLLAYLVRRLLENGANSSFVNRIGDTEVSIDALIADPVAEAQALAPVGRPHEAIAAPRDLYRPRINSAGLDLTNDDVLAALHAAVAASYGRDHQAAGPTDAGGAWSPALNPARRDDVVGHVADVSPEAIDAAFRRAVTAAPSWAASPPPDRAAALERAADLMEARTLELVALIVREAGRTLPNALSEVREAVDFLRYYASEVRPWGPRARPLGPVVCISPWNFPLAIFTGQVAAALAAGNPVLAKPAEETPLTAAAAVAILHEAGLPDEVVQLLPGAGEVGAALVADRRACGVVFTGSTEVARLIQRALSERLGPDGRPVPLIAETGGQNAMVVDSSALAEQVVVDAVASAFDSAGQRCSALRALCVQEDVADRMLAMLRGAMAELDVGDPAKLETDVGPVISEQARRAIEDHVAAMRGRGFPVHSAAPPAGCSGGAFVAPTLIEIGRLSDLEGEVFGPVLHVVRYAREDFGRLLGEIDATGYGLTFGLHTRIDETIERALGAVAAGNVYVNRNIIGAAVGSQPFGGHGLSGTGPKAGGPLYLRRLVAQAPADLELHGAAAPAAEAWAAWLLTSGRHALAARCRALAARSPLGAALALPGPVGERNTYELRPCGAVLCRARSEEGLIVQIGAALATGNVALAAGPPAIEGHLARLPAPLSDWVMIGRLRQDRPLSAVLVEDDEREILAALRETAALAGQIVPVHVTPRGDDDGAIPLEWLVAERSVSVNVAAAGGDAALMTLDG